MFYHTALGAHWLILSAIALWIYRNDIKKITKLILWCILAFLCVTINLYFTPIILGILFCAMLEEILAQRKWISQSITFISPILVTFLTMYIFGGFYGGISSEMSGLGTFSFNLNAPYNSLDFSYFFKSHGIAFPGQNEGFCYLGLGVFILLVVSIFISLYKKTDGQVYSKVVYGKIPLAVAVVVFTVLAISPTVTFDTKTILSIKYPQFIFNLLSIFRSSGRFIWPVYYILFIYIFRTIAEFKVYKTTIPILVICFFIQMVDFIPVFKEKSYLFKEEKIYESTLKSDVWQDYAEKYEHIMFYAPLWDLYLYPDIAYNFEVYAKENNMTLNGTYFSRDMSDKINPLTYERFEMLRNGTAEDDTLYVFPGEIPKGNYGLWYKVVDGYTIGIKKQS